MASPSIARKMSSKIGVPILVADKKPFLPFLTHQQGLPCCPADVVQISGEDGLGQQFALLIVQPLILILGSELLLDRMLSSRSSGSL